MKKILIIVVSVVTFLAITIVSCKKHNSPAIDKGCSCNTDSVIYHITDWTGTLGYINNQYEQGWAINIRFPGNAAWICKLCNVPKAQNLINGITTNDTIPVKFSGKLTNYCSDEPTAIYSGIVVPYHLNLDSLKRN